jgi:hypothetical protein
MTARYLIGDVFEQLATLENGSVDLVLTSPPFLALRSYLPADHPDKGKEIGSEPTPGAFVDTLLALSEEWARVLAPHGSLCVELGDTYSGTGGAGGDWSDSPATTKARVPNGSDAGPSRRVITDGWPLAKSLCLIPELYRIALVYGFNPLTGRQTPRWRARNVVRWCRPNPPVGALGDKVRPATSDMVVACKSAKRWFDLDAVRQPYSENTNARTAKGVDSLERSGKSADRDGNWSTLPERNNDGAGAPPLDHWWHDQLPQDAWLIPTHGFKGSHYATWPPDLLVTPIEAMCPRKVCRTCGKPSERITVDTAEYESLKDSGFGVDDDPRRNGKRGDGRAPASLRSQGRGGLTRMSDTVGWTDCGHGDWRNGVVLDPFAGSGTTLAVATGHGRDAIGIDLDPRNADLARQRCGMFLEVPTT